MAANYGNSGSLIFAGFWARLAAYLVDCAIIIIIGLVIVIGSAFAGEEGMLIGSIVNLLVNLLYWPVLESSSRQATFGKSIVGIQVTDLNGNRVSFLRAFFRNLAKIVSAIPLCIGFLLAAFTSRKQALHDIITDSLVVRTGSSSFFKAFAAALGGLVIAAGASGAYIYFNYLPQMEKEFAGAMQEAMKSADVKAPEKPPVVKSFAQRPPAAPAVSAVSAVPAIPAVSSQPKLAAPMPASPVVPAKPAISAPNNVASTTLAQPRKPEVEPAPQPVKPKSDVRKSSPKKTRIKAPSAPPVRKVSEPDVAATNQQIAPLLPAVLPDPGVIVAPLELDPAAEPIIVTTKYNDILTAVLRSDKDAVKQLLDMGRWVDKPGSSGMTPLMGAVMNRDAEMVKLLLEHGAEPSSHALKQARKNKDAATVLLLERHGAR